MWDLADEILGSESLVWSVDKMKGRNWDVIEGERWVFQNYLGVIFRVGKEEFAQVNEQNLDLENRKFNISTKITYRK